MNLHALPKELDDWPPCLIDQAIAMHLNRLPPREKDDPITDRHIREMRRMRDEGAHPAAIAKRMNVTPYTVAKYAPESKVRVCEQCGKEYTKPRNIAWSSFRRRRFCSMSCSGLSSWATSPIRSKARVVSAEDAHKFLELWRLGLTKTQIAEITGYSQDAVHRHIKASEGLGDE